MRPNCGAEIEKERIPVFPDLLSYGAKFGINVKDAVLHGGEEYALLFTSSLRESDLSTRLGRPVYAIGRITKARADRAERRRRSAAARSARLGSLRLTGEIRRGHGADECADAEGRADCVGATPALHQRL